MRVAGWSWGGLVLRSFPRQVAMSAGLAALAVTGVAAGPAAVSVARPVSPGDAAQGPMSLGPAASGPASGPAAWHAGSAPQVPAGAQFVSSPRTIPVSGGARQACPTPSRPGQMACMALVPKRARVLADAGPPGGAYAPADLRNAYGLTSAAARGGQGGPITVAIVDAYDDPRARRDLAVYRAHYGLPACPASGAAPCLRIVNSAGGSRLPRADRTGDWQFEVSVDLDMVSAICPYCRILLVEARSDSIASLSAAEGYASRHASVVSNSWGSGAEFTGENAFDSRFDHPGVAIVAAGGDSGYGTQYPAASQFVTAVGGTTLLGATATDRGTQTAWSGTGSGCSSLEPRPSWQAGTTPSGCTNRTETDVSADADPRTPVAVYDTAAATVPGISAGWNAAGGTSVATPIVAAAYALAGAPAAGSYPAAYPYRHSADFTDVRSGSNGRCEAARRYLCRAGAGYDGLTGLGTPDGTDGFSAPAAGVTVTNPGTQDVALGQWSRVRIAAISTSGSRLSFGSAGLPPGLSLDRSGGLISGRPAAAAGTFMITVTATDQGAGSGSVTFAIVVVRRMADRHPVVGPVRLDVRGGCLSAGGGRISAGAMVEVRACDGQRGLRWRFVPGTGPGGAGLLKTRGGCLSARAGARNRARVTLRACSGSAAQRWRYRSRGQLYNPGSGECLADPAPSATTGARVVTRACSASPAQSWELPAGPVLSAVAGRCLTAPGDSGTHGIKVTISRCGSHRAQRWTMKRDATLRVRGGCLAVAGGSMLDGAAIELARCSGAASQRWFTGPAGQLINGRSGRCLADPGDSAAAGTRLVQEDCYGKPGEIWAVS